MSGEKPIKKIGEGIFVSELQSEALTKAKEKAEALKGILRVNEFMQAIELLIQEIKTVPLARRFSAEKGVNPIFDFGPEGAATNPNLKGLSEAEHKRRSLEIQARRIQNDILELAARIDGMVLDFEAAKTEWGKQEEK